MRKSLKEFFPKLIFALFFVYVLLLGVMNLLIVSKKDSIELYLADMLEAQEVHIGDISNLPLIFISGSSFSIIVNDELSLTIKDVYVQYRVYEIFTGNFERFIRSINIDNISFHGHTAEIKTYKKILSEKFSSAPPPDPEQLSPILDNAVSKLSIKRIDLTFNSMTEFWHTVSINKLEASLQRNTLYWDAHIDVYSIWSNQVFLAESSIYSRGTISNIISPNGYINTTIQNLNLIGLPIIETNLTVNVNLAQGRPTVNIMNYSTNNQIEFSKTNGLHLSVKSAIDIAYKDFEEFYLLDYAFKPGRWIFDLDIKQSDDWKVDWYFKSLQHPNYGLELNLESITKEKLYSVYLDLNTHYFGSIRGDLSLPIRKGLYPLPRGVLYLDNTRFVLNGLIFSGDIIADVVKNKNELDVALLNVRMNNGLIGNTAARFEFTPDGVFNIYPRFLPNSAVDITASIGSSVSVDFKAHNINGDFVAQNIKVPIFGIKDSMYKGEVHLRKKDRKSSLILDGVLKGYLDEEEQIDAVIGLVDNHIKVPRFYIKSPDILLSGDVIIDSFFSNTIVKIDAQGSYYSNDIMPINLTVDIQKYETTVNGLVNNQIPIKTRTVGMDTDFTVDFEDFPMEKLGYAGIIDASLIMRFDEFGITRFSIQEGNWNVLGRNVTIDFDALQNTNSNTLETSYFRFGLDRDILDGYGYFSFLENCFGWSFRFNRGGLFQFNMGRYIVKSRINVVNYTIDNIFDLEIFNSASILRTEETETTLLQADMTMEGTWDNLRYKGNFHLEGADPFLLAVGKLDLSSDRFIIDDLRLRHSQVNLDADIDSSPEKNDISGSFAYQNIVKSDFVFKHQKTNSIDIVNYYFPNFYMLSKKPLALRGKIFYDGQEFLFLSDHAKYGFVGSVDIGSQISWDFTLINESIRLLSRGILNQQDDINANLKLDVNLNKLVPSGDLRRTKGHLFLDTAITGSITEPIVDGRFDMSNLDLNFRSLRNRILMPDTQSIFISNNFVTIPDIIIESRGGGTFGLDGMIQYENQTIETMDIRFYSRTPTSREAFSYFAWNFDIPLITARGTTYINEINISGNFEESLLFADILAEKVNFNLELDDTLGNSDVSINPIFGLLEGVNLDVNIDFTDRTRFSSQFFSIDFEQEDPIKIEGSLDDIRISGGFYIETGSLNYLNSTLDISSGTIDFSGDSDDPYPTISINAESSQEYQGDLLEISVTFEGKAPDIELTTISSFPTKDRTELLNVLSGAVSLGETGSVTQELLASGVGIAENTLFTNPFNRRLQQLVPFVDSIQLRTDILGNLTRTANEETGTMVSGLDLLNGTEVEISQYIPKIKGLSATYNYRLESADNSSSLETTSSIDQIHRLGFSYTRMLPYQNQIGIGVGFQYEVNSTQQESQGEPEPLLEGSWRKKF